MTTGGSIRAATDPINPGERMLGIFHIAMGLWLVYLTFATTLNLSLNYHLPGG